MTETQANVFERARAFGLSIGIRRATSVVRRANNVRLARTRGDAELESWSLRFLREYVLEIRADGADTVDLIALLEEVFGDSPELKGLLAELSTELIAKLANPSGGTQDGGDGGL